MKLDRIQQIIVAKHEWVLAKKDVSSLLRWSKEDSKGSVDWSNKGYIKLGNRHFSGIDMDPDKKGLQCNLILSYYILNSKLGCELDHIIKNAEITGKYEYKFESYRVNVENRGIWIDTKGRETYLSDLPFDPIYKVVIEQSKNIKISHFVRNVGEMTYVLDSSGKLHIYNTSVFDLIVEAISSYDSSAIYLDTFKYIDKEEFHYHNKVFSYENDKWISLYKRDILDAYGVVKGLYTHYGIPMETFKLNKYVDSWIPSNKTYFNITNVTIHEHNKWKIWLNDIPCLTYIDGRYTVDISPSEFDRDLYYALKDVLSEDQRLIVTTTLSKIDNNTYTLVGIGDLNVKYIRVNLVNQFNVELVGIDGKRYFYNEGVLGKTIVTETEEILVFYSEGNYEVVEKSSKVLRYLENLNISIDRSDYLSESFSDYDVITYKEYLFIDNHSNELIVYKNNRYLETWYIP